LNRNTENTTQITRKTGNVGEENTIARKKQDSASNGALDDQNFHGDAH